MISNLLTLLVGEWELGYLPDDQLKEQKTAYKTSRKYHFKYKGIELSTSLCLRVNLLNFDYF